MTEPVPRTALTLVRTLTPSPAEPSRTVEPSRPAEPSRLGRITEEVG